MATDLSNYLQSKKGRPISTGYLKRLQKLVGQGFGFSAYIAHHMTAKTIGGYK